MGGVAVVTGGTRGIGKAISIALQAQGYKVAATYFENTDKAVEFSQQTNIPVFQWNVGNYAACEAGVGEIQTKLGQCDILVNNAGISRDALFDKMTERMWREVININLGGCFNMAHAVFSGMCERRFGRIINITSIVGQKGASGLCNYAASKAGVIGFTKALAQEGARHMVTVNAVAPGYVDTDMVAAIPRRIMDKIIMQIPVGRVGAPEEIAQAVVFLSARENAYITGITLSINGGQYVS